MWRRKVGVFTGGGAAPKQSYGKHHVERVCSVIVVAKKEAKEEKDSTVLKSLKASKKGSGTKRRKSPQGQEERLQLKR